MKILTSYLAAFLVFTVTVAVRAQPTSSAVSVPSGEFAPAAAIEKAAMPADRIEHPILLDEELTAIRANVPNFNSAIVRDPGVGADYPTIPAMTLKNVTVGQFLQFIQASFPGVECRRIDGTDGSLYAIRIRLDEEAIRRAQMAQEKNRVRLYRLNEFINALADESAANEKGIAKGEGGGNEKSREERIKEATNQVLSLIQAALDQTDSSEPSMVKIHEPTLTLMFKGSAAKQAVLQDALSALQPRGAGQPYRASQSSLDAPSVVNPYRDYKNFQVPSSSSAPPTGAQLPQQSQDLESRLAASQNELNRQRKEIDDLKKQMDLARRKAAATQSF